ncbi:Glutamine cyclotransferase [Entamoeba marina]
MWSCFLLIFLIFPLFAVKIEKCVAINYDKIIIKGLDVINKYPHDSNAYCQGITIYNNTLYESTGLYGNSTLRKLDKQSGKMTYHTNLPTNYFGEGLVIYNDAIYQLTWRNRVVQVYDSHTFRESHTFRLPYQIKEGWGMTVVNNSFVISDGTDSLFVINPYTFTVQSIIKVTRGGVPLKMINEIEYIDGLIYANVWFEDVIVLIDLTSGKVVSEFWCNIDRKPGEEVFNGIALNKTSETVLLTGKLWNSLFEVKILK